MGNTGTHDQHVHYQLKDPAGHAIDPAGFWDRLGPAKTDPGQPAYLDEYQQYSRLPNQALALPPDRSNSFDNRFGNWPVAPFVSPPDPATFAAQSSPPTLTAMFRFCAAALPENRGQPCLTG
jgi:hypothetical protein